MAPTPPAMETQPVVLELSIDIAALILADVCGRRPVVLPTPESSFCHVSPES